MVYLYSLYLLNCQSVGSSRGLGLKCLSKISFHLKALCLRNSLPPGKVAYKLKFVFIAPLVISLAVVMSIFIFILYQSTQSNIKSQLSQTQEVTEKFYQHSLDYSVRTLSSMGSMLQQNDLLKSSFTNQDRQGLLQQSMPIFNQLKQELNITHFYYINLDHSVFLRVHAPDYFGDKVGRDSFKRAATTGSSAYGAELGPLGTLTLREVLPWYDSVTHQKIGYIELGIEIDQAVQQLRDLLDDGIIVPINKQSLSQSSWESGMNKLGRDVEWDEFSNVILGDQVEKTVMPGPISQCLAQDSFENLCSNFLWEKSSGPYRVISFPVSTISGEIIAKLLVMVDISKELLLARHAIFIGSSLILVTGIVLFIFFYAFLSQLAIKIEQDETALEHAARHDGLTGLYNHKSFYDLLDAEFKRAIRYSHEIAVLMIDIDFFKKVNDTYGHQAGDRVLKTLGQTLNRLTRDSDSVCRYGGEEITIIIPNQKDDTVLEVAERLRSTVEEMAVEYNNQMIYITVSIGVAFKVDDSASSAVDLIKAADAAVYVAKRKGRNCIHIGK